MLHTSFRFVDKEEPFNGVDKNDAVQKTDKKDDKDEVLAVLQQESEQQPGKRVDEDDDGRHVHPEPEESVIKPDLIIEYYFLLETACQGS